MKTLLAQTLAAGLLMLGGTLLYADSSSNSEEHLGLFSMEETHYIIGSGADELEITRTVTRCAKNKGFFQSLVPVEGVTPVTEIEMLHALNDKEAVVVDMRTEDYFLQETIPHAINIPYTEVELRLDELGCTMKGKEWDCAKASKVYAFCNGPVCPQSPTAIKSMVRRGFPTDKIYYYRGGMLDWTALGLTTVKGAF
ncbi:MAG: rhodanese-like domain-containing protein [Thiovulaceae bacterium]|nr:rhodanese-like domain-containing protein [Sulfurimonadaceae bacterium]